MLFGVCAGIIFGVYAGTILEVFCLCHGHQIVNENWEVIEYLARSSFSFLSMKFLDLQTDLVSLALPFFGEWRQNRVGIATSMCFLKQVNVYHFGAAMRSLEVSSCWSKSMSLLSDFFALNLEGNVIIYSSCVNACEKSSQWMKALELLREATCMYIQLDTMIYSAVISAHAQVRLQES